MITLRFGGLLGGPGTDIGPAVGFRLGGNFLRQLPENAIVGRYENHHWIVGETAHARFDCEGRAEIYFEDVEGAQTGRLGPFSKIFVADGTMFCDGDIFAKFAEETILWHSMKLETYWPTLVISSVE